MPKRSKLEHRKQDVATLPRFVARLGRYWLVATALVVISLLIGTVGYKLTGCNTWVDSFYMASMILTGMGPSETMHTESAKLFSSFYALYSGLAFLTSSAVVLSPIIHRLLHILHVEREGEKTEGE